MVYCHHCGTQCDDVDNFCHKCGTALKNSAQAAAAAPIEAAPVASPTSAHAAAGSDTGKANGAETAALETTKAKPTMLSENGLRLVANTMAASVNDNLRRDETEALQRARTVAAEMSGNGSGKKRTRKGSAVSASASATAPDDAEDADAPPKKAPRRLAPGTEGSYNVKYPQKMPEKRHNGQPTVFSRLDKSKDALKPPPPKQQQPQPQPQPQRKGKQQQQQQQKSPQNAKKAQKPKAQKQSQQHKNAKKTVFNRLNK